MLTSFSRVSNLGGTFPRFFILKLVDYFTIADCIPPTDLTGFKASNPDSSPVTGPFSCAIEADKQRCTKGGGTCEIKRDGFYWTNVICVILGALTFWLYIQKNAMRLQRLPLRAWRLANSEGQGGS